MAGGRGGSGPVKWGNGLLGLPPLAVNRQIHTSENITFPQLRWRAVKIQLHAVRLVQYLISTYRASYNGNLFTAPSLYFPPPPSSPHNQSVSTGVNHYFNHTVQNGVYLFYHSSINPNGTRALQPPLLLSSHHLFSSSAFSLWFRLQRHFFATFCTVT